MNQQKITMRQAILWFILYQIGSSFIIIPSILTTIAKQDAWLSVLITIGLSMLCILLYAAIANQSQGKSMNEHLTSLLGKWVGNVLIIVFIVCYPLLIFIMTLRNLGDFVTTSIMSETPVEVIYFLMLIAVYFIVRAGVAVIGRSAELLFFIVPALYMLNILTLLPSAKIEYILPIFENGYKPVLLASFTLLGFPYVECAIFLYLVLHMNQPHKWKKTVIVSSLISGSMYLFMLLIITAVLSEGVTSNLTYASYYVIRTISIADFIERFEILITVFWYVSIFFRLSLLLFVSVHALSGVFRLKDAHSLLIPLLLITVAMTYSIWPNATYLIEFTPVYTWYAMIFGIIGPFFIWLIGKWRLPK